MSHKRFRTSLSSIAQYRREAHPSKRLKALEISDDDIHSLHQSFESSESEEHYREELVPRFSNHPSTNSKLHSRNLSPQHEDHKTTSPTHAQNDDGILRNILAYNPHARRPTFDLERPGARDQLINDIQRAESMIWCLICEYSKNCFDLSSRSDAVNAIQNYLARHIYSTMLPNISETSCYEIKATALATLTKITFITLSNEPSVNRINGLLHARVCDLLGDAMVKVVDMMTENDLRHFVHKEELYPRMKELQKLVAKLRWPIEGLERIMECFNKAFMRSRQGRFNTSLRKAFS